MHVLDERSKCFFPRVASLQVLGEHYTVEEEEDMTVATVQGLWIACGRRKIPVEEAVAGQVRRSRRKKKEEERAKDFIFFQAVFIGGVSQHIAKTATIADANCSSDTRIFTPLSHSGSVIKIAIEPVNPSELPKLVEGIRRASRAYPALVSRVEESGEHTLLAPGELYLDSVMYDLRHTYADMEIKVKRGRRIRLSMSARLIFSISSYLGQRSFCSAAGNMHRCISTSVSCNDAKRAESSVGAVCSDGSEACACARGKKTHVEGCYEFNEFPPWFSLVK